jgi:hypothetical protein
LNDDWVETSSDWEFDGNNGYKLMKSSGYLMLSDLPTDELDGYTISFQAKGGNSQFATLAWVYLSADENGNLIDGFSFINGSEISYHPTSSNKGNYSNISDLAFIRTDNFVNITLTFVNGEVIIYVNDVHCVTQRLSGIYPAFSFYRGNQDYHIRNFYITLD